MNFIEAVQSGFKKYADFKTRSSRSEFWFWVLFTFILNIITSIFDSIMFQVGPGQTGPIGLILSLALLCPNISIGARRLHDINKSGWWQLLVLTVIGIIPLIYWLCKKGDEETNRFGHDPLDTRYISSM